MKIKKGFELREVCGEHIIVAYGRENIDFNKVISLNESASFLWKNIVDKDFDAETMAGLLQQEYEVDAETALKDAQALLDDVEVACHVRHHRVHRHFCLCHLWRSSVLDQAVRHLRRLDCGYGDCYWWRNDS